MNDETYIKIVIKPNDAGNIVMNVKREGLTPIEALGLIDLAKNKIIMQSFFGFEDREKQV